MISAMSDVKTRNTRKVLAGLNLSGLDRIYQQLDKELGLILTFHHVHPDPVPEFSPNAHLSIHPEFLEQVIQLLRSRNFDIIALDEARARILEPVQGARFAVLTFDDGYRDTLEHAVPVLQKHGTPYSVYFAPGLIDHSADLWWEGIEALVRQEQCISIKSNDDLLDLNCEGLANKQASFNHLINHLVTDVPELQQRLFVRDVCARYDVDLDAILQTEMMNWREVQQTLEDPLCTIGAHTLNHQALARLTAEQAATEIDNGVSALEEKSGHRARHFAFPYGYRAAAAERDFKIAGDLGFETAVTTRPGMIFAEHRDHLTALPRISVNGLFQNIRHFAPLTSGLPTRLSTGWRKLDVG